jgi:hypothetical protein
MVSVFLFFKAHQRVWQGGLGGQLVLLSLALILGILVGGISAAENLSSFPVNAFLYIFGGIMFVGFRERTGDQIAEEHTEKNRNDAVEKLTAGAVLN